MSSQVAGISIRAMEPEDLPAYNRIHNHPDVVLEIMQPPYVALSERLERIRNTPNVRNLVAVLDGATVGFGDLTLFSGRRSHAASFGLAVDPTHSGKGVGSALLTALLDLGERWYGIRRFEIKVYADNERAIALLERFGFEIEATHRRFAQRDGVYADAYTMARLVS